MEKRKLKNPLFNLKTNKLVKILSNHMLSTKQNIMAFLKLFNKSIPRVSNRSIFELFCSVINIKETRKCEKLFKAFEKVTFTIWIVFKLDYFPAGL